MTPILIAGLCYLIITMPLGYLVRRLEARQDASPDPSAADPEPAARRSAIRALHKSFGQARGAQGIDFHVARGEVVCVIGPSGSGKSTLLRCINLLEEPTSGKVWSAGTRSPTRTSTSTRSGAGSAWCSSSSTCFRTSTCWRT